MSAPPVKIRIGGAIENSLASSLRTAAQMVGQAEKAIQQQKRQTTKIAEDEAKKQLKAQQALARASDSLDRQRSRGLFAQYREQQTAAERAAKGQERAVERAHAAERREIEKTARAAAAAIDKERRAREQEARAARRRLESTGESFARRTSHRATRFLMPEMPIGPMVMGGLRSVASGMGVDFSIAGGVRRVVDLERQATDLSNSGYQAGANGANGQRVDPRALVAQARQVSGQFGVDAGDALGALAQYQKIAGDLETGRQSLAGMAALSQATGTNLEAMAAATANVSNGLGEVPDKARIIDEVMRTIAGQGKLGAVEITDMATQMARIAAAAGNFGGDRAKNIQEFGALAQIARAEGGAPSAAESARSMGGFANTFRKGARNKEFTAITGKSAFTDSSNRYLRDPIDLIKDALLATKGDQLKMNKIFMDVVGGRTVTGLTKTFNGAGGGEAGIKKVDEQLQRMMKAQISTEERDASAKAAGETTAAKAARFQNELDKVTEGVMAKLVPALDRAGPAILQFAQIIGDTATWAVDNPKQAIATAIGLSVARAGIESMLRSGIERAMLGAPGANGVGSRAGTLGSVASKVGGALTIASLLVTTLTVGMATIDALYMKAQADQRRAVETDATATNSSSEARAAEGSGDIQGAIAAQKKAIEGKQSALDQTNGQKTTSWYGKAFEWEASNLGGASTEFVEAMKTRDQSLQRTTQQQQRELAEMRGHLARLVELAEANGGGGGDVPPNRVPQ